MKELLILIPAYNEEKSLGKMLESIHDMGISAIADVLVVNDGSSDKTSLIARSHGARIVTHVFNMGYGSALQVGYKYATRRGYQYLIQIDADGQHDIANVRMIYEKLRGENGQVPSDIVIGSRFLDGSVSFPVSKSKKIVISCFRKIIKITTGCTVTDPTSGLQGLSRRAFLFYSFYSNFDYRYPDANMIIQMLLKGYKVDEIPAVMHAREEGTSMHSGLKPVFYMMVMSLSILTVFLRGKFFTGKK